MVLSTLALSVLLGQVNPQTAIGTNPAVQAYQGVPRAERSVGTAAPPVTPPPADEPAPTQGGSFRMARVVFEGNTVVSTSELAELARPYELRTVELRELKQLTAKVRDLYRRKGYILARAAIPPQTLKPGGDVRLLISEGRYGQAIVKNNRHYSERFVRERFARAMRGGLVEQSRLQRTLLILNEYPDLTVRTLFVPGTEAGTSDVVIDVHDRSRFHFGFDFNNYGNDLVGRNRAGLALWGGNIAFEGDELTARYTEPFPSRSEPLIQAGYSAPVGTDGNRLGYSFATASTRVSGALEVLDIRGDAEIHALNFIRPIQRTLSRTSNVNAALVFKKIENFVLGTTRVSKDDLRLLTYGVDHTAVRDRQRTSVSVLATQGLGELFAGNRQGDPESSRVGSGNEFTKFNAELFHVLDLGHKQFLLARFSGQVSLDPLTVSEQFALGGPDSVRGYIQSDYLGDDGFTTSLEYRRGIYTSSSRKVNVQAAAFIDHGDSSLQLPQTGEVASRSFTGVGAGVRAGVGRTTSIRADVGFPLSDRNSLNKDAILYTQLVSRW